jgi:hypothetical protein
MGQVHTAFRFGDYCTSEFDVTPAFGATSHHRALRVFHSYGT